MSIYESAHPTNPVPLITIGMTAFNAVATIQAAVGAALAQDWVGFEVVIVDDCSTDGTFEFVKSISDPRVRVFQNERNGGVAATRNRIIEEARGEFIAFFDDDDVSHPSRLSRQYRRIVMYESAFAAGAPVICHTARRQRYPDGREIYISTMGMDESVLAPAGRGVAERILKGKPMKGAYGACATCSQMARRGIYQSIGGFDPSFRRSEDTEFNIRLALAGGHFAGINDALVLQAMTLSTDKKLGDERAAILSVLEKHRRAVMSEADAAFCAKWLMAKYEFLEGHTVNFVFKIICLSLSNPLRVLQRLLWAIPNIRHNTAFGRFHRGSDR